MTSAVRVPPPSHPPPPSPLKTISPEEEPSAKERLQIPIANEEENADDFVVENLNSSLDKQYLVSSAAECEDTKRDKVPLVSDEQQLERALQMGYDEEDLRAVLLLENARLRNEHMQLMNSDLQRENERMKEALKMRQQWAQYMPQQAMSQWSVGGCSPSNASVSGFQSCYDSDSSPPARSSTSSFSSCSSFSGNVERGAPKVIEDTPAQERTTVMMRNIPNNYTREMLFNLLNEKGLAKKYDLVYLPVDFKKKVGLGYAFINFIDHEVAASFWDIFHGFNRWIAQSDKVCEVTWSDALQGRKANIERYRNSPIMHESVPDLCKPVLFDKNGEMEPFPPPTKKIRPPREWRIE